MKTNQPTKRGNGKMERIILQIKAQRLSTPWVDYNDIPISKLLFSDLWTCITTEHASGLSLTWVRLTCMQSELIFILGQAIHHWESAAIGKIGNVYVSDPGCCSSPFKTVCWELLRLCIRRSSWQMRIKRPSCVCCVAIHQQVTTPRWITVPLSIKWSGWKRVSKAVFTSIILCLFGAALILFTQCGLSSELKSHHH